jgi:hypothetical protein
MKPTNIAHPNSGGSRYRERTPASSAAQGCEIRHGAQC